MSSSVKNGLLTANLLHILIVDMLDTNAQSYQFPNFFVFNHFLIFIRIVQILSKPDTTNSFCLNNLDTNISFF